MWDAVYENAKILDLPGGAVCCLRAGSGPVVMLIHGIPLSLATWRHNIEALARDFSVIAVDMRGFGRSEKPEGGDYSVEAHARVLADVLDAFGHERVSLIASSYGCAPAIRLALDDPGRVERLVLINSVGCPRGGHSAERVLRIRLIEALLRRALRTSWMGRSIFASRLCKSYADRALATGEVVDFYYRQLLGERGERTFLATLKRFDERALAMQIQRLSCETLILWGGRDKVLPIASGAWLHKRIAGSRLEILEDCGHLPHEEDPERVNALIADFLLPHAVQERALRAV